MLHRVDWLSPDASLVLKFNGIVLISKRRPCDAAHASTLLYEHNESEPSHYYAYSSSPMSFVGRCISTLLDLLDKTASACSINLLLKPS